MKYSIQNAPFIHEFCAVTDEIYSHGWAENNGGNVSVILKPEQLADCIDLRKPLRTIPTGFDASALTGKYLLVTRSGNRFRCISRAPERELGVIHICEDGANMEVLWGLPGKTKPTSELASHVRSHAVRLNKDKNHSVVMHVHADNLLAMSYIHTLDEREFTRTLWQMHNEGIAIFPEGVGVLPWMLCGTDDIGIATAEKMKDFRVVVWAHHGVFCAGSDLDDAFGLLEVVDKAAGTYLKIRPYERVNNITPEQMRRAAEYLNVDYRKDFLN